MIYSKEFYRQAKENLKDPRYCESDCSTCYYGVIYLYDPNYDLCYAALAQKAAKDYIFKYEKIKRFRELLNDN